MSPFNGMRRENRCTFNAFVRCLRAAFLCRGVRTSPQNLQDIPHADKDRGAVSAAPFSPVQASTKAPSTASGAARRTLPTRRSMPNISGCKRSAGRSMRGRKPSSSRCCPRLRPRRASSCAWPARPANCCPVPGPMPSRMRCMRVAGPSRPNGMPKAASRRCLS